MFTYNFLNKNKTVHMCIYIYMIYMCVWCVCIYVAKYRDRDNC